MPNDIQGGSNMTETCAACLHTNQSRSYLNHLVYICRTAPLTSRFCILYITQQICVQNILNMLHTLRCFSSKCRLFHNATFFGSCVIHILYTECAKIKKKIRRQMVKCVGLYFTFHIKCVRLYFISLQYEPPHYTIYRSKHY